MYSYNGALAPPGCWIIGGSGAALQTAKSLAAPAATLASTASRSLPGNYAPSVAIGVTNTITPDESISFYAAEDTPPAGWTVSNIDNGGAWDEANKKVKWLFVDNLPRALSYQATPSSVTTGTQTFTGTASFDGDGMNIAGATTIQPMPYWAWKSSHFTLAELTNSAVSGDFACPASDGLANLLKYGLLLDPKVASVTGLPTTAILNGYLTLTYRQNQQATDIVFVVEACDLVDAGFWNTNGLWEVSRVDCNTWWIVTISDGVAVTNAPSRFMHLNIIRP
jgi:hypothetical protein